MTLSSTLQPGTDIELPALREKIARIYQSQQAFFKSGATLPYSFRKTQLKKLAAVIKQNEAKINEALYKDLRKSKMEAYASEIGILYKQIRHTLRHLREWMEPVRVSTPMVFFPSSAKIIRDPLGVILIQSPWNFPFLLVLDPLVHAMAGGNTAILKPSEEAPHTAALIEQLVTENFDASYISVFNGPGHIITPELVTHYHFDHIFFTGSVAVGKKVMEMAARQLSPVTLELGGKSPCIVDKSVNLDHAAKKIAWSKFFNAGQTCVAPDYVLVHAEVKEAFVSKLKAAFDRMLGDDPRQSQDYGRLINRKRFDVVSAYIRQGRVLHGGQTDAEDLFIAPTILEGVSIEDPVMQEEIFGPVLPVISYTEQQEVLDWIEKNPYPLALYIYTSSRKTERFYTEHVRYGGGCVNNCIIHLGNPELPFGGVGTSGIGQYHGRYGFETFTRPKSILKTPTWLDFPLWYAPYRDHLKYVKMFFRL